MEFLDPGRLQMLLLFAVPGVVAVYVRTQFLTGRMPPTGEGILVYVTVSLVYHALAFPLRPSFDSAPLTRLWTLQWLLFILVLPALLGVLLGLNARYSWIGTALRKLHLVTAHPIGCAWDWRFSGSSECWVLIVLRDGMKWAGHLGPDSFISSDPRERDIYIQQVYEIGDEDKWIARTSGVWINHSEIQSIEFWPMKGEAT
jgi:hypothetical protein